MDQNAYSEVSANYFCCGTAVCCLVAGALVGSIIGVIYAVNSLSFWMSGAYVLLASGATAVVLSIYIGRSECHKIGEIITSSFLGYTVGYCVFYAILFHLFQLVF
ncbi:MAG: hypothetical protein PHE24_00830 [Patescibacteria group bacterium]|nr:hypothetical protein [Patescibacteria group bacterium]